MWGSGVDKSKLTMRLVASTSALLALPAIVSAADLAAPLPSLTTAFTASLTINEYYTDNVFFSRPLFTERRLDDIVTVINPKFNYAFEKGVDRVNLGATSEIGRFATYSSEDYEDFNLYTNGRHRLDPMTIAVWGANIEREHEARDSIEPSDQIGAVPTVYWHTGAYGAVSRKMGDKTVKLGVTYDGYNFEDVATGFGPPDINNDDRDRDMLTAGARLTHDLDNATEIYAEGSFDLREYRQAVDDNTFDRDSRGGRGIVGWRKRFGNTVDAELYAGIIYQTFDDGRFSDVVAADYGGSLSWRPLPGTSVRVKANRTLEETTLFGVSSYLRSAASLNVSQTIRDDLRVYGGGSVASLDFQDSTRSDQLTSAWLGIRKYVAPKVFIGAEAAYQERESNLPVNDYTESRVMARVGVETDDAYAEGALEDADLSSNVDAYVGVRGGVSSLATMLDGPRQGPNGSLTADFGDFGLSGSVVGGIAVDIAKWSLGLEADIGLADVDWDHSRLPGGRVFSVDRNENFGMSGLIGRRLSGGSLLYGRAGVRLANFTTNYERTGNTARRDETELGFEYGVGVRAPVSSNISLSMEYVHSAFDDYALGVGGNNLPDRFANTESAVRFGASYHFNPIPREVEPAVSYNFAGGYWGLQVGHGGFASRTTGARLAEGVPPVDSILNADFGDTGFTFGGLAGYNFQTGSFVYGAEIDAELAQQQWDHFRQPNGRVFSVEKVASLGASVRAGYAVSSNALVYGRVGVVGSLFDTDFSNSGFSGSQEQWRTGLRFGGGIEVPVSDSIAVRLDYTFTDYGTHVLATPPGDERYDTQESLFRLGGIMKL